MINEYKQEIVKTAWLEAIIGGLKGEGYELGPMELRKFYNNLNIFRKEDPSEKNGDTNPCSTRVYKLLKENRPDLYEPLAEWAKEANNAHKAYWKQWRKDYDARKNKEKDEDYDE